MTGLGAPRGRGAAPGGQICCTSPELDFGRHRAPRPLVSRGRSRKLVYRGTVAYHVGAERQGTHSPSPLTLVQHSLFSSGVTAASKKRFKPEGCVQARRLRHPWDGLASNHGVRAHRATADHKRSQAVPIYSSCNRKRLHSSLLSQKERRLQKKALPDRRHTATLRLHQATHYKTPPQRS